MPRALSASAKASAFSDTTGKAWLMLVTVSPHPDAGEEFPGDPDENFAPIRLVNDKVDHMSGGDNYVAFAFDAVFPPEASGELGGVRFQVDGVDQQIINTLRKATLPPQVAVEVILSDDPDTIEVGPVEFQLTDLQFIVEKIDGTIDPEPLLKEPFPADDFVPAKFKGLF